MRPRVQARDYLKFHHSTLSLQARQHCRTKNSMLLDFLLFLSGLWAISAPPPLKVWRLARVAYPPLVMLQILMLYCMNPSRAVEKGVL